MGDDGLVEAAEITVLDGHPVSSVSPTVADLDPNSFRVGRMGVSDSALTNRNAQGVADLDPVGETGQVGPVEPEGPLCSAVGAYGPAGGPATGGHRQARDHEVVWVGDQRDSVTGFGGEVQFCASDVDPFQVNVGASGETLVPVDAGGKEDDASGPGHRIDGCLDVCRVISGGASVSYTDLTLPTILRV